MTLTLGIGRSFNRTAGATHGPTVQIARSPTSIALSAGSPTAALTFTAKDANGVATLARVYAVSSDPTVTTVDKDTWVATRVASGSAVIYGQLTDPNTAPVFDGTGTILLDDDFSTYTTLADLGSATPVFSSGPYVYPLHSPLENNTAVNPAFESIITPGHAGDANALRMSYPGTDQTTRGFTSRHLLQTGQTAPGATDTSYFEYYFRNIFSGPLNAGNVNYKFLKLYTTNNFLEINTHNASAVHTGGTNFGYVYWQLTGVVIAGELGEQPVGPYFRDCSDGNWHKFSVALRQNTPNAGTVTIAFQNPATTPQTGTATFSVSGADGLTVGDIITVNDVSPYLVTAFDGVYTATLQKVNADAAHDPRTDTVGYSNWSRMGDGILRAWVDDSPIIDISSRAVNVTPTGGDKVWCQRVDIFGLPANFVWNAIVWGDVITSASDPFTYDIAHPRWWYKP